MATINLAAVCLFLLLGAHVGDARLHAESRRRTNDGVTKLFVFGDAFGDNGNRQKTALDKYSRGWYAPYGQSFGGPTGRYSDGLIEPDFIARILGLGQTSPPPNRGRGANQVDRFGATFALTGSRVLPSQNNPSLGSEIDVFQRMVAAGIVNGDDLHGSVALIAVAGNSDFAQLTEAESSQNTIRSVADSVTDGIADAVNRLQRLGVPKVMVNLFQPMGCTPWRSAYNGYSTCDSFGNSIASIANAQLREKLGSNNGVLLLDVYTAISDLVSNSGSTPYSQQFTHKFTPCCAAKDTENDGYCGEVDSDGEPQYSVCDNPDRHFYWDYMFPTQAGWNAVVDLLEQDIRNFL